MIDQDVTPGLTQKHWQEANDKSSKAQLLEALAAKRVLTEKKNAQPKS